MKKLLLLAALAFAVVLVSGCGEEPPHAATRDTVETITQYKKIQSGKRTQEKVRKLDEEHSKDLSEVGVE